MNWPEEVNKIEENFNEILSFDDYFKRFQQNAARECRSSCHYLRDMFDHFGVDDKGVYKLFLKSYPGSPAVCGQTSTQRAIYQNLTNFTEEGFNNKFLLLVGPNGSAKTSLIRKMMEAGEEYSKLDEGALYTFSWIFPVDNYVKGRLGLSDRGESGSIDRLGSYALLEDKEISSILTSELRDHPLLLIPLQTRRQLIDEALANNQEALEEVRKSYLYNSDLSKRNKMIFETLLKSYQGKYTEVLRHIRVERFVISRRYSSGAVTVEPQLHVDARLQQITMDKRLGSLPPSLQSLNLFTIQGELVMSNRGVLEFSDLLKRPLDAFKYLLMTMEGRTINIQGILTELDIFFIGSSNEIHLAAFKQHPDFLSFKGRMNFVRVPYLLNYHHEAGIYQEQVNNIRDKSYFEPHTLDTLCLWAVMTRLRAPQSKSFEDKRLSQIVAMLTPLEKALLYADEKVPEKLSSEEKQILKRSIETICNEYVNDKLYEGKFGISPREIKQIIYELGTESKVITVIDMLEFLTRFNERKNEYDFLNIAPQGDYHNPHRFIESLKEYQVSLFDFELRDCLGLIDDRSYEDYIYRYVQNIICLMKGEKSYNSITGKFEEIDMFFVKEFETNIRLKESPEVYRSHMISNLGAYSLDHPNEKIVYTVVFPEVVQALKESFREEQKKVILNVSKNLVYFITEMEDPESRKQNALSEENRLQIIQIVDQLKNKFHYSERGALTLLKYLLKERY